MAGYDPNQPRDEIGQWTIAGNAARKAAGLENFDTLLKGMNFEDFVESSNKKQFIEKYVQDLSAELGFKQSVEILSDQEFYSKIERAARSEGFSPQDIKMAYSRNTGVISLKESSIKNIRTKNDLRLFMQTLDHEIFHGFYYKILNMKPEVIRSQQEYFGSVTEYFADALSSRVGVLRRNLKAGNKIPDNLIEYLMRGL